MDGTVISDAVNLASRIESMTKIYGAFLLISERTYDRLQDPSEYTIRTIGRVKVKGKSEAVVVYEVLDGDPSGVLDLKQKTLANFELGVTLYHEKQFEEARKIFARIQEQNAADRPATFYMNLCGQFVKTGVPEDWTGVLMMD